MTNRAAYKIERTAALASELKRIWGASSLTLYVQGVDHALLHLQPPRRSARTRSPGLSRTACRRLTSPCGSGLSLFAPILFGPADPGCAACIARSSASLRQPRPLGWSHERARGPGLAPVR
jgi:hypothetical protein